MTELRGREQFRLCNRAGSGFGRRLQRLDRHRRGQLDQRQLHRGRSRAARRRHRARHADESAQDPAGFSYVLTTPDYQDCRASGRSSQPALRRRSRIALDAETVRVNLPKHYFNNPVQFLADAGDLKIDVRSDREGRHQRAHRNDRHGRRHHAGAGRDRARQSLDHDRDDQPSRPAGPFTNAQSQTQTNTTHSSHGVRPQADLHLGAPTLAQVVRALNTIGVSPRDLIAIVQALRESGSLQADIEII